MSKKIVYLILNTNIGWAKTLTQVQENHTIINHDITNLFYNERFLYSRCRRVRSGDQCILFSRFIGELTLKIIYLYYLKKYFMDQSIQKMFYLILKKEALQATLRYSCLLQYWTHRCPGESFNTYTVGPLIIESFWAKKRVSTGALEALDDPLVVQTKFWKSGWVPEDITQHL